MSQYIKYFIYVSQFSQSRHYCPILGIRKLKLEVGWRAR